jgi:hypothetical protein
LAIRDWLGADRMTSAASEASTNNSTSNNTSNETARLIPYQISHRAFLVTLIIHKINSGDR